MSQQILFPIAFYRTLENQGIPQFTKYDGSKTKIKCFDEIIESTNKKCNIFYLSFGNQNSILVDNLERIFILRENNQSTTIALLDGQVDDRSDKKQQKYVVIIHESKHGYKTKCFIDFSPYNKKEVHDQMCHTEGMDYLEWEVGTYSEQEFDDSQSYGDYECIEIDDFFVDPQTFDYLIQNKKNKQLFESIKQQIPFEEFKKKYDCSDSCLHLKLMNDREKIMFRALYHQFVDDNPWEIINIFRSMC